MTIYHSGERVTTGSHGTNSYDYVSGDGLVDNGDSTWVIASGTGIGLGTTGIIHEWAMDSPNFTFDSQNAVEDIAGLMHGSIPESPDYHTTKPVRDGTHALNLSSSSDRRLGFNTDTAFDNTDWGFDVLESWTIAWWSTAPDDMHTDNALYHHNDPSANLSSSEYPNDKIWIKLGKDIEEYVQLRVGGAEVKTFFRDSSNWTHWILSHVGGGDYRLAWNDHTYDVTGLPAVSLEGTDRATFGGSVSGEYDSRIYLDRVLMFNRDLSHAEMKDLYNSY